MFLLETLAIHSEILAIHKDLNTNILNLKYRNHMKNYKDRNNIIITIKMRINMNKKINNTNKRQDII